MAGIDQDHFKPVGLQDLVRCYPVTARALQGDRGDSALFEPERHLVERGRVTAEGPHRFRAPPRRDRRNFFSTAYNNPICRTNHAANLLSANAS